MNRNETKRDVLFFSTVDWSVFQRPQSLALEFARRGYRVLYFQPMLSIRTIALHLVRFESFKPPRPPKEGLHVLRPFLSLSTFRSGFTSTIDRYLFRWWFNIINDRYHIQKDAIVIVALPYWWDNIIDRGLFPRGKVIYDCADDCCMFSRNSRILQRMQQSEIILARDADACLATSDELYTRMKQYNDATFIIPNGVAPDFFNEHSHGNPLEILGLERPLYGYVGSLDDRVDFEVLSKIAKEVKTGTVVLVGLPDRKRKALVKDLTQKHSNVAFLGPRPYSQVPSYIKSFDVCLIPYKDGERIRINTINPLKLTEYMLFGKPVVALRTDEIKKYNRYVYLYENGDIKDAIERASGEPLFDPIREERIKFAFENSWEKRVDRIEEILTRVTSPGAHCQISEKDEVKS